MKFPNEFVLVIDVKEDAAEITSTLDELGFKDTEWEFDYKYYYIRNMEVMWRLEPRFVRDNEVLNSLPHIMYSSLQKGIIPWGVIKDEFKYVAMDEDGTWWAFKDEPYSDEAGCWWGVGLTLTALKMPSHEGDWKDSLTKRPE